MKVWLGGRLFNKILLVLSYGLFLAWILSFLYDGPVLQRFFHHSQINEAVLAIAYVGFPAILCFVLSLFQLEKLPWTKIMVFSLVISIVGTLLMMNLARTQLQTLVTLVAAILGATTLLFIAGWGVAFVAWTHLDQMVGLMGITICLGKIIYSLNQWLFAMKIEGISEGVLVFGLVGALAVVVKMDRDRSAIKSETRHSKMLIPYNYLVLLPMLLLFFCVNIGGGITESLLTDKISANYPAMYSVNILIYGLVGSLFIVGSSRFAKFMPTAMVATAISMAFIGVGFILFFLKKDSEPIIYLLNTVGYLMLDIILWSSTAKLGKLFQRPVKVFLSAMGVNLTAFAIGNILGAYVDSSAAIGAIGLMVAFPFAVVFFQKIGEIQKKFMSAGHYLNVERFTDKEYEIILLMIDGLKNKEIAEKTGITDNTLKTHAKHIYQKAEVKNKKELVKKYHKGELC